MKIPPDVDEFLKANKQVNIALLEKKFPHIDKTDLENFIVQQKWTKKVELKGASSQKKVIKWLLIIAVFFFRNFACLSFFFF